MMHSKSVIIYDRFPYSGSKFNLDTVLFMCGVNSVLGRAGRLEKIAL